MSFKEDPMVPKWLTDLQQRSWEPEILLSGIVLYGMFKVPSLLDGFLLYFKLNIFGDLQDVDNLVALFKVGVYWLILGLVLHLVCRGIWIGMVGLSYAFPEGIRMDRLKYQGPFREKVERTPSYEQIVIKLEKLCSALFSFSFMLFMSLIGGYLFLFVLVIFPFMVSYSFLEIGFSGSFYEWFQVYVIMVMVVGVIGLIDFLSLGYLRRFYWFSRFYWPLHVIISTLTLSRFYRAIYYGMATNFNRWTFFTLLALFSVTSIFGSGISSSSFYEGDVFSRLKLWEARRGEIIFTGHYGDQNQDYPSVRAQIPSDVIKDDILRLFLVADIQREDDILEHTSLDSLIELYPDSAVVDLQLLTIKNFHHVLIDDRQVEIDKWFFHYNVKTSQRGYLTYIPIDSLARGIHTLRVNGPTGSRYARINFYRE